MTQAHSYTATGPDVSRLVETLVDYAGPPEDFLQKMLEAQCQSVGAQAAAIIALEQPPSLAAVYPPPTEGETAPLWLAQSIDAIKRNDPPQQVQKLPIRHSEDLYGQAAREHVVMVPIRRQGQIRGVAAYDFPLQDAAALELAASQLIWAVAMLSNYELRQTLAQRSAVVKRLLGSQELLATLNEQHHFQAAAMAMCNELATRFEADRVALGFLHGRYVKLVALSHTEKFTRKMRIVQDLEAAMEEVVDQDLEVVYPPDEKATYISRAAAELSRQHGPAAIAGLPVRYKGDPVGVLLVQRDEAKPFALAEVEALRLICELTAPRQVELYERDRWFGARWAKKLGGSFSWFVGATHTWYKVAAIAVLAVSLFMIFARGTYRVEAPFMVEAEQRLAVPAPFDGIVEQVYVKPGDQVAAGVTVLAELQTDELEQELNYARAQQRSHLREADVAMRQGKHGERLISQAKADEAAAQINLLQYRLAKSKVISNVTGVVIQGDLHERANAPVQRGEVMLEVAPVDDLRATLMVPEDRVFDLVRAQRGEAGEAKLLEGELATAAEPGKYLPFVVESISPVAEAIEQRNVFRVKVRFTPDEATLPLVRDLRPGMEGLGKIEVGQRSYAWMWTRDLINWVRMKLWM